MGLTSVVAFKKNIELIYIASSYTKQDVGITCASDPTIDNTLRFANTRIVHDQYNLSRQEKVENIVQYAVKSQQYPFLRVCWEEKGGKNCCHCEKCYRTIFGILAAGGDPNQFGFTYTSKLNRKIRYELLYKINLTEGQRIFWKDIQKSIMQKDIGSQYQWITNINFDDINSNWRKLRKKIGKCKRLILGRK